MAKELPFFRFTASEWLTDDISEESYELKGLFSDVVSYYWMKDCTVTKEKLFKRFSNARVLLEQLFSINIIKENKGDFIKINFLDLQYDLLSEKREKRQKSGKLGGLKKASNAKAKAYQKPSYKDKDKDNIKSRGFSIPTTLRIKDYCLTNNYVIDADRFHDFYHSKGWMVGKTKMKDWQAAVRNWHRRQEESKNNKPKSFAQQDDDNLADFIKNQETKIEIHKRRLQHSETRHISD